MAVNEAYLDASPEDIWDVLSDPYAYPRWVVGSKRIRGVDPDWPAVGIFAQRGRVRPNRLGVSVAAKIGYPVDTVYKTLVAAGQCTKVDAEARPAAVGLLGCGVMAGIGAAINTGAITRGRSIAVIGCGGVGVAAIAGAALAGASPIIAVDIDAKKLEKAKSMGATHTVDSSQVDPVEEIKRICAETYEGAEGADVVVEAVGRPETWKQAFYARDLAGTVVLVGVPTPDMKIPEIPLIDVFGRGGALKSSWYGDCLPSRDFPMLVDLYQQGRLDLDAFVTEEIGIGDIEAAFEKMHHAPDGQSVLRSVVVL